MQFDVGLMGAFLAGLASFVSPCVLPIVPPYLCFLAGVSLDELTGADGRAAPGSQRRILLTALLFALGFGTVFVALGAAASLLGQVVSAYFDTLRIFAGVLILLVGLHVIGVLRIPLLYRQARVEVERRPPGVLGAYLVGLAFGFGWTPCVGPILAVILFTAAVEETAWQGAALLGAYAAGMGLPFVAAAAFAAPFMALMRRFRRHMGWVERGMGAVLVATGVLFIGNFIPDIANWMLAYVPVSG